MIIINSELQDIDLIFKLYDRAIEYQKSRFHRHWYSFDKELLVKEIREQRHWKIQVGGQLYCVFSVSFTDFLIWNEKDMDPSIYLHRIVTHPDFMGNKYVKDIVAWAKGYGRGLKKKFIRLDTFSDSPKLNNYYIECGFSFSGIKHFDKSENVPQHYLDGDLSLFEINIERFAQS